MQKDIKDKWVKALRSGKYRQSRQMLRKPKGGYCCLGVLCDVLKDEPEVQGEWSLRGSGDPYDFIVNGDLSEGKSIYKAISDTAIPHVMKRYVGLSEWVEDELISLNDDEGYSFEKIADFIEKEVATND